LPLTHPLAQRPETLARARHVVRAGHEIKRGFTGPAAAAADSRAAAAAAS
jgi:hypothetical protein